MSDAMQDSQLKKEHVRIPLSPVENLCVGAIGGALETCLQMPLITYKFCLQEGRTLPVGVASWYRGLTVQAGTVAPITAIQFLVNGLLHSLVRRGVARELTGSELICTAMGAGAISAVVYSPVDLVTIQQQKLQLSPFQTVRYIVNDFGFMGLFRGLSSCAIREAVYTGGYLGLAPIATAQLTQNADFFKDKPLAAGLTGACLAGAASAIITHPVDTVKTKIQADMAGTKYASAMDAGKILWKENSIISFFKGGLPRTFRICGAFFVCMSLRDIAIGYKTRLYGSDS